MEIEIKLNGEHITVHADPRETLLMILREYLYMRGTKNGCGEGECGACTVLLNNQPINACLILAGQAHGAEILTIEGMDNDPIGRHIIKTFAELGAVQCGYCTPGMIISTRALLANNPRPSIEEIQTALGGNFCRCTGYKKIIDAVLAASEILSGQQLSIEGYVALSRAVKTKSYIRPGSLDEAILVLTEGGDWHLLGGITDLGVQNKNRMKEKKWLDMSIVPGYREIREDEKSICIGGGATFSDILNSQSLQKWAIPLVQAAKKIGAIQIQNRATLAGNIVNASPAADAIPALFVLNASIGLHSKQGKREIPVCEFAIGPGKTVIANDEILFEIIVPKRNENGEEVAFFKKFGQRNSQTISIASIALRGWLMNGRFKYVSIAMGAVSPTVIFADESAGYIQAGSLTLNRIEKAGKLAADACQPINDIRASAEYRRSLISGLLVQGLYQYVQGSGHKVKKIAT